MPVTNGFKKKSCLFGNESGYPTLSLWKRLCTVCFVLQWCVAKLNVLLVLINVHDIMLFMFHESRPIFTHCYILRRSRLQTATLAMAFGIPLI